MCLSCGCVLAGTGTPDDDHGDPANITLADLGAAAAAGGVRFAAAAANILATVQAGDLVADQELVSKEATPQRFVLGIAYKCGRDSRIAKGVDGGRDYFSKAELEKAAWSFLRDGPVVNAFHVDGTEGCATVVESSIHRGPDWDLGDGIVVKDGDWLVGAILDERAWQWHLDGKITGWSPQGTARRRQARSVN